MAETLKVKGLKVHQFPSKAAYKAALHQGVIKEGEFSVVEGEEQYDTVPTKGSENLVNSGAVYKALEEVYEEVEEVETIPVTTAEIIALWNKIMNEGAV